MTLGHSTTWWGIWDEPYTYGENFYAAAPDVETAAKDLVTGNTFAKIEDDPEPDIDVGELEKSLKPKPVVDYWSGWSTKPWAPGVIFNETGDIYGSYSSGYAGGGYVGSSDSPARTTAHTASGYATQDRYVNGFSGCWIVTSSTPSTGQRMTTALFCAWAQTLMVLLALRLWSGDTAAAICTQCRHFKC